jgi:transposase-like protein
MDALNVPESLLEAVTWFDDFEHCRQFMMLLRWPDGKVRCPRQDCGSDHVFYIAKERVWKCYGKHNHAKFSLKTGTIFEDSPIKLEKWLPATWLLINCKNGISSYELGKALKVTQKSAWFMLHRIRLAMRSGGFEKLSGEIEADETFVGGKVRNMHRRSKRNIQAKNDGNWGKTVVLGLLERDGRVRAAVAPTRSYYNVHQNLMANVELGSTLYTDEFTAYQTLPPDQFTHEIINKLEGYVKGRVHVNGMENFWSLMKRTLKGTYVSVDPVHLQAYLDEQCLRFDLRKLTDSERFVGVMKQIVGKRLTYDELTGKTGDSSSAVRPT